MKSRFVLVTTILCAIITHASAQIDEATAVVYVNKVKMTQSTQNQLTNTAQSIINTNYGAVLVEWNAIGGQYGSSTPTYQFQGSIGYKMALSLPVEAKSDVDVAFLYLYKGGTNQPSSPQASKLKESARDVFRNRYGSLYSYDIKDPVVVLTQGTGTAADHFDIAFFDELLNAAATPPKAQCVNSAVKTFPCSELNWGITTGTSQWPANDRLNLIDMLNRQFDRTQDSAIIHEAGMMFKEWRHQMYHTADTDVVNPEKPPSIALVTLLYNFVNKQPPVYYINAFALLRDTIQNAAAVNFKNGQCTNSPSTFAITAITYPNDNLLGKLTTAQKQEFCTKLMAFRDALVDATAPGTTNAQGVAKLQPYLPLFP